MNDIELVKDCMGGDGEEFRLLVDKYKGKAMALALNVLKNREDAEDACQDTFFLAFKNLEKFDVHKSFSNWLFTILYNRCLDRLRKRRRFLNFFKKMKGEANPYEGVQRSAQAQDRSLPQSLLDVLNTKERISLFLWANEGCTCEEIAGVLKCSPSTARVHLFKARKKIKSLLENKNA